MLQDELNILDDSNDDILEKYRSNIGLNFKHNSNLNCNVNCASKSLKLTENHCHLPMPLSQANVFKPVDDLLKLVHLKLEFIANVEKIKAIYDSNFEKIIVSKLYQCYKDLQNVLNTDPDVYFASSYNWYYTGGNLKHLHTPDCDTIFHVVDGKQISAVELERKPSYWKEKTKQNITDKFNEDIFQLDLTQKNNNTLLCARLKYQILLYNLNKTNDDKIGLNNCNTIKDDVPFVGVSFNKFSRAEYSTINAYHFVKTYDIVTHQQKSTFYNVECESDGDHFTQIIHYNNHILYINRKNFHLIDTRINKSAMLLKAENLLTLSDRFTNICLRDDNSIYFSSFRDVLQVDFRNFSTINQWSHTFDYAPFISDTLSLKDRNILCISSCIPNEKLIIQQNNHQQNLPICPPNLINSLEFSLIRDGNIIKQLEIKKRLELSTTGVQLYENNNDITIFSANTVGDLFTQDVTPKDKTEDFEELKERFLKWNRNILEESKKEENVEPLYFMDKVVLIKTNANHKEPPDRNEKEENSKKESLQNCIKNLKNRVKGYNPKIMNAWTDITKGPDLSEIEEYNPVSNIQSWLKQIQPGMPSEN